VTISVFANAGGPRSAEVEFVSGTSSVKYAFEQDGTLLEIADGYYWLIANNAGANVAASPVPADKKYGYLAVAEATATAAPGASAFYFAAIEGGYTIQDSDGKYYYQKGTYDSFNLDDNPVEGSVWTVKSYVAGTWKITNNAVSKWMQYDPNYSSMGSYSSQKGLLPLLIDATNAPEDEPEAPQEGPKTMTVADAVAQADSAIVSGTVVAVCARGFILQDKTAATLIYEGSKYSQTFVVGDEVKAGGAPAIYNFASQIAPNPKYYEKTGNKAFTQPTPKVIDAAALDALVATLAGKDKAKDHLVPAEYVQMEATLSVSGTYYNLVVDGTQNQGSIYYPIEAISSQFEALNGKKVLVKGWANGVSGGKYLNIVATSIEAK
jgi:hypothetical protein